MLPKLVLFCSKIIQTKYNYKSKNILIIKVIIDHTSTSLYFNKRKLKNLNGKLFQKHKTNH